MHRFACGEVDSLPHRIHVHDGQAIRSGAAPSTFTQFGPQGMWAAHGDCDRHEARLHCHRRSPAHSVIETLHHFLLLLKRFGRFAKGKRRPRLSPGCFPAGA